MPTWGEILKELQTLSQAQGGKPVFDEVRRKYLALLQQKTGRNIIFYASAWTQTGKAIASPQALTITDEDVQGLMEVVHGLKGNSLDLILHSPGGSAEATESIVSYLRKKFSDIRVIVPHAAMSAATMLACSSNKILMGKQSSLGPIDPQMLLQTQVGMQMIPAQAILDQFEMAKHQVKDPKILAAWMPILGQYGPALLIQCQNALKLSKQLVSDWLSLYMFGNQKKSNKPKEIAEYLSNHKNFQTHGRHIDRDLAKKIGLVIEDLENDQQLQDLVLSAYHAMTHTLSATPSVKIIENHIGKAFIKTQAQQVIIQGPPSGFPQRLPGPPPGP
jgi:ATP-dependent protease ClpP protease subunit